MSASCVQAFVANKKCECVLYLLLGPLGPIKHAKCTNFQQEACLLLPVVDAGQGVGDADFKIHWRHDSHPRLARNLLQQGGHLLLTDGGHCRVGRWLLQQLPSHAAAAAALLWEQHVRDGRQGTPSCRGREGEKPAAQDLAIAIVEHNDCKHDEPIAEKQPALCPRGLHCPLVGRVDEPATRPVPSATAQK